MTNELFTFYTLDFAVIAEDADKVMDLVARWLISAILVCAEI